MKWKLPRWLGGPSPAKVAMTEEAMEAAIVRMWAEFKSGLHAEPALSVSPTAVPVSVSTPIQPEAPVDTPAPPPALIQEPTMSDVTELAEGKITVPQFVAKTVSEINANPVLKAAAGFLLMMATPALTKALGNSTAAEAIIADIQTGLSGGTTISSGLAAIGL